MAFLDTAGPRDGLSSDRAWWLRVPAVLLSPRPVFFALREEDPDDVVARSEPVLLHVWLAGAASVLASPTASGLLDNPDYDPALLAVWTFIAGGLYGAVGYFVAGFSLYFGAMLLGSAGSFRRERQVLAFALVPLALSFLLLLPVRLALYGGDTFRDGGADEGAGEMVLLVAQLGFAAWSVGLLVVGMQVVHGWSWPRSLAAVGAALALLAAVVAVFALLF
ncbi:MAG: Yip1 family protein [Gaiellaceae bacterium]